MRVLPIEVASRDDSAVFLYATEVELVILLHREAFVEASPSVVHDPHKRVSTPKHPARTRDHLDAFDGFEVAGLVAALGAGPNAELLLFGQLLGLEHLADAGAIDADGLLGEQVLAGVDGRFDVPGAEAGGRGQDDKVDVRRTV